MSWSGDRVAVAALTAEHVREADVTRAALAALPPTPTS